MSVFRSRNKWRAEVFHNGRRVAGKSGFERQREAQRWHDETAERYRHGDPTLTERPKSFEDLLDRFERFHLAGLSQATRTRYGTELDQRIRPYFRFMQLDRIGPEMLESFKAELGRDLSPVSANYCLDLLRLILARAVKWKLLRQSPYELEPFHVGDSTYQWWDDKAHIARFLEVARERSSYYPVYLLALETGMRYGEAVGLHRGDVHLVDGRIHVQRAWDLATGDFGLPKHGKTRWVDFNPHGELARELRRSLAQSQHEHLVFPSRGGRVLTYSKVAQKVFKSLQRRAKVPELSFHDLRHTFASWYMLEQDNIWALQGILGHADIQTTQRYAHHSKKLRRAPLDMAALVTHRSRTSWEPRVVNGRGD